MSYPSSPTPAATILAQIIDGLGLKSQFACFKLQQHWEETVGALIAGYSTPNAIRRDTLILDVTTPVGMQELSFLKGEIIEKANAYLGDLTIKQIHLQIQRSPPPAL